jgi:L-malate glycosyltransferase
VTRPHVVMLAGHLTFVQDWAAAAAMSGADVTLLRQGRHRDRFQYYPAVNVGVATATFPGFRIRPSRLFRRVNAFLAGIALRRALAAVEAESSPITHIHTHFYAGSAAAGRVAASLHIPVIHTEHSSAIVARSVSPQGRRELQEICELAATVFAVSQELARAMHELGVRQPVEVLSNPVDTNLFSGTPVTAAYPPDDSGWRFVTVGWLVSGKNHVAIVDAFARIAQRETNSRLTIIGAGDCLGDLQQQARGLGISEQVYFLGRLSRREVAEVLAASHCYVHASKVETFGVALVEAWGSGLPVVTFECGGVAPLADEIGGRTVAGWDPADLADAMLLETQHVSKQQRRSIRALALRRFDRQVVAQRLGETYASANADPRPGRRFHPEKGDLSRRMFRGTGMMSRVFASGRRARR